MKINLDIDDKLINDVLRLSKVKTKKEAIEDALQEYLRILIQKELLSLKGQVPWKGNLDEMRSI